MEEEEEGGEEEDDDDDDDDEEEEQEEQETELNSDGGDGRSFQAIIINVPVRETLEG